MSKQRIANAPGKAVLDCTLQFGLVTLQGKLYAVADSDSSSSFKLVCPKCTKPTQGLGQMLKCKDNEQHGPFFPAEIVSRGKEVDGKFVVVSQETIAAAKESVLPDSLFGLNVHPRDEVLAHTFPNGNTYVFLPLPLATTPYSLLVELLKERQDLCMVAKVKYRKADHLIMISVGKDDQLVAQELVWPQDVRSFSPPVIEHNKEHFQMGQKLLLSLNEPFDPEMYRADSRERIAEVVEEATGKPAGRKAAPKPQVAPSSDALVSMLEASLTKPKAPAKKATKQTRKAS